MHFGAVSRRLAGKSVFLYNPLESFPLGSPDHVDKLAGLKLAHAQIRVTVECGSIRHSKFPNEFLRLRIGLLEMAKQRLRHSRFLLRVKPHLNSAVSVPFGILYLQNRISFSLDH